MTGRLRRSLLVLLVFLAACSTEPAPSEPQTRPEPSATPTTFMNGGECPVATSPDLPSDAGCVSTAGALTVYALLDGDMRPLSWRMRVGSLDQRLDAGNAFSYPRAIGEVDFDDDGDPDWFVKTFDLASHGTNWQQLNLFLLDGNRFVPLRSEGEALAVRVGGISRMGEGARCGGGMLVRLRTVAENRQNTIWSFSERTYRVEGRDAIETGVERGVLHLEDYNDPQLDPYYAVNCDGLSYP